MKKTIIVAIAATFFFASGTCSAQAKQKGDRSTSELRQIEFEKAKQKKELQFELISLETKLMEEITSLASITTRPEKAVIQVAVPSIPKLKKLMGDDASKREKRQCTCMRIIPSKEKKCNGNC
ncbi:MAG: hypothetical protein GY847_23460 [Proteobacteria bacterium]|nr:hypothetical protein [Pseudomonadota bacterium]